MQEKTAHDLELELHEKFKELHISWGQRKAIFLMLEEIKNHDFETYLHSLRVCFESVEIAYFLGLEPRPLFFAGLLHDYGKISIDGEILRKNKDFSEADFEKVKKHSMSAYFRLKDLYPFSAEIILRHHHYYDVNAYPKRVPKTKFNEESIERDARILALVDFRDALIFRNNEKFKMDVNDKNQVREILIKYHEGLESLINSLFEKGIF